MTWIGVLGPIAVGTPAVSVANDRQRRLLVALLLAGDQGVAADRLVEQVWTDRDAPDSARAALRTYAHRLRQLIPDGPRRLVSSNGRYVLARDDLEVDSEQFERLLEQDAACDDAAERLQLLTEALALWRGPAYDDLGDLPWLAADRVRLLEKRLTTQETLLTLRLDGGDEATVAVEADYLLRQHPYREALRATQMIALYRCNRQADALTAYHEHRTLLLDELGIDTSPELQDLQRRILRQDPTLLSAPTVRRQVRGYVFDVVVRTGPRSRVVRAVQQSTGRVVSVELFAGDVADSEAFIHGFENDARVLARLQHPHIAPVLDFWREPGRACLVSAHVPTTLAAVWRDQPWPAERVARAVDDTASALQAAHQQGVCHGALTGATVLLDEDHVLVGGFRVAPRAPPPERGVAADIEALGRLLAEGLACARPDDPRAQAWADVAERAQSSIPTTRFDSIGALREALDVGAVAASPLVANPYRGLEAFDEQDAAVFAGRESVIEVLLGRVAVSPLCAVVGPSGVGKSSVILAGLLPAVRSGALPGDWLVARMRPSQTPVAALDECLRSVWPGGGSPPELDLRRDSLVDAARIITSNANTHLLLVIDQFEATWSADVADSERERFLGLLVEALNEPDLPLRVVLTLRADRYDEPLAHAGLARQLESATVALGPLADAEAALAVSTPATRAGVSIAPELVGRLVADSADSPGSLPLLQFTLTELFDRRSGPELTMGSYDELGGLPGALVRRAEATFAEIEGGAGASTRRLMSRLVTIDTEGRVHRVRAPRSDLLRLPGVTEETLAELSDSRLIVLSRDEATREPTVELAHEALLTAWPRLRAWMDEDRSLLVERHLVATSATAWRADNRDEAGLLQGSRLERAEELKNGHPHLLDPDERQFVEASMARRTAQQVAEAEASQREARTSRRLRSALRLVASAAAAILVVSALAISQWRGAASERDAAALSALVASALQVADERPKVALRMAAAAYLADPGPIGQRALLGVLNDVRPTSRVLLQGVVTDAPLGSVCRARLSRGPEVVALGNPTATGSELVAHNLATGAVRRMVSPLRCSALALGDGRFVGRIDDGSGSRATYGVVDDGAVAVRFPDDVVAVHDVVEDGVLVGAVAGKDDDITLAVADPDSGTLIRRSTIPVRSTVLSDKGDVAVVLANGDARIVDVGSLTVSASLEPGPATYAWKPDGSEVVAFGNDDTAHRFGADGSLLTLRSTAVLPQVGDVVGYTFAPDGTRVAVAGTAGVQLLDYPALDPIGQRLFLEADVVATTWLTPSQLALVGPDGSVEVVDWVSNRLEQAVRHTRRGEPVSIAAPGVGAAQGLDGRWIYVDLVSGEEIEAWYQPGGPLVVIDRDRALTPLGEGSPPTLLNRSGQQLATGATPMADPGAALSDPFVDYSRGLVHLVVKAAPSDATSVVVRTLDLATMEVSETAPIEVDPWTLRPDLSADGFSAVGRESRTLQTWRWDGGVVAPPLALAADQVAADVDLTRSRAAVVTDDGAAIIYDLDDQTVLQILRADARPEAPLMLPDGRAVIRTRAGNLVLWDVDRGTQLGVVATAPTPDSRTDRGLPAIIHDNRLWFTRADEFVQVDVAPQRWRDLACDTAPQPLTAAEVAAYVPAEFDYREGCG